MNVERRERTDLLELGIRAAWALAVEDTFGAEAQLYHEFAKQGVFRSATCRG